MIPDTIKKQIRDGEGLGTEFKTSAKPMDEIAKVVCSFLNTKGGTVFCGIDDSGKIVGINDARNTALHLQTFFNETISPNALFSVNIDEEDNQSIITIEVPQGKDRPYVFKGAVYIRQQSITRTADTNTLRDMVQSKSVEADRWERRPAMALEADDLDSEEIRKTKDDAVKAGRFTFSDSKDHMAILAELGVFRSGVFTQAADVFFAKNPALRHPQVRVRATRFAEDKGSDDYLDDQIFSGPLVTVFNKVLDFIERNIAIASQFKNDRIQREDKRQYPLYALREGLVNAFAHRDYAGFSGGLSVGIYPSRIEIWNSGRLPKELKVGDLRKNHPSLPTNPDIAHLLYIRGLMERIGRGTQKIINACKEYGLPAPKWQDQPSGVTLTLFSSKSPASDEITLNVRQNALIKALSPGDEIRPIDYRKKFASDVSDRQARRDLTELAELTLLERKGKGAGTRYSRTNRT
ncbi:MAG: RNA-binding domain-containing protein [Pseudomonadota bacterium]